MQLISMFDKCPPKVDLLIVDEAQHDAAMSMGNLHSAIKPELTLGLSATPFRTDRVKLCFEKSITDAGIGQLIQDGYLSRYHHYTIPAYTPESVAWFFSRDRRRWGKSLLFFHRYDQCLKCQRLLAAEGVHAEIVTGHTDRERQLEDFAAGRTDVLINMAILTEGFDCPSLKTVFCRPSGKGCTVQMGGRVFRQHPEAAVQADRAVQGDAAPVREDGRARRAVRVAGRRVAHVEAESAAWGDQLQLAAADCFDPRGAAGVCVAQPAAGESVSISESVSASRSDAANCQNQHNFSSLTPRRSL